MNDPNSELFASTDSCRHAQPLKHVQYVSFDEPLTLELGGRLPRLCVAYETYGRLNRERANAVLVCHALSGDSHVARHSPEDDLGWWDIVVGPGKPIDTDRYFVICPNILGGCRGTTGPSSINPETDRPYGADFPLITVGDMTTVQKQLIDRLGIDKLLAVVGGSLGGHMVLDWATRFPERLAGAAAIATSPCLTSQALAFDIVGRNAILRDPEFQSGRYYDHPPGPTVGLALARMLGHITYLSREAMMQKFDARRLDPHDIQSQFETRFSVGSYLAYQGDKFVDRFDANSYITLTLAMDVFNLGDTPQRLTDVLGGSRCRWLLLSFSSDWLFPPFQTQQLLDALLASNRPVSYCNVRTDCGHDAFLLPNELDVYGELLRAFLANLDGDPPSAAFGNGNDPYAASPGCHSPASIFHHRLDYDSILNLIPSGASVLDLGCGTGGLLDRLRAKGHQRTMGVEWDQRAILACVCRGLDVIHADLNQGLGAFPDCQFDFVVLSQTLQTVTDVEGVLREMLRVGHRGIVSFPNLAYHKARSQLAEQGRAPGLVVSEGFQWYNTPNVRFFSISDFEEFCRDRGICIHQRIPLDTESVRTVVEDPNRNADVAVFVVSK